MDPASDKADIIVRVCSCLSKDDTEGAKQIILSECPFGPKPVIEAYKPPEGRKPVVTLSQAKPGRDFSYEERTRVFIRDGFIDRYNGKRVIFPATLQLISQVLPHEFPYQSNWKSKAGHQLYYDLSAIVGHIIPPLRGGGDAFDNLVCISMNTVMWKDIYLLEELPLKTLYPPGNREKWDGLIRWFLNYLDAHEEMDNEKEMQVWGTAARRTLKNPPRSFSVHDSTHGLSI